MILSIDLASVRYRDNGIALLDPTSGRPSVEFIKPADLGLSGMPDAERFAGTIDTLAGRHAVRLILLDGPQGWRARSSELPHSRRCERETLTPGKTGVPHVVKPASWTRMVLFSVALFDALDQRGWPRLRSNWAGERAAVESFPTHAWRALGHPSLPGKSSRVDLEVWRRPLEERHVNTSLARASHDELQAVVAGLAGCRMTAGGLASCDVAGVDPMLEDGIWREGLIVSPRARDERT